MENKINVLVFHELTSSDPTTFEAVRLDIFEKVLQLTKGKTGLSNDMVDKDYIITFDDGYKSDVTLALPLLQKYDAKAVFFIVVENVGKSGYMNWEDIKCLCAAGMEIGSHSLSHPNFRNISNESSKIEFELSKKILEKNLNCEIVSFAFPYGFYRKNHIKSAANLGFQYLYCSDHGLNNSFSMNLIRRNSINSKITMNNVYNVLFPSRTKCFIWCVEDVTKNLFKILLGSFYRNVRNYLWK